MVSYNKVILAGNLTRDPELRYSADGKAWMKVGMAINDRYRDQTGEVQERVHFFDLVSFGRNAETLSQYCKKGDPLLVDGTLSHDRWEDEEGKTRNRVSVMLRRYQFLPRARAGERAA